MSDWTWVDRLVEALESGEQMSPDQFRRSIDLARRQSERQERAACAAIADGADTLVEGTYQPDHPRVAQRIAWAIRGRGDQ